MGMTHMTTPHDYQTTKQVFSSHQLPPPPSVPPPYAEHVTVVSPGGELSLAERVADVSHKLDLEAALVKDLVSWAGTEVVVVADDSGSMSRVADSATYTTRWDELKQRLTQLLDILLLIDDGGGFELRFLNRGGAVMIKSQEDLQACWQWASPGGVTPLGKVLREYLNPVTLETDRLLLVMTDGCPSDVSFEELRRMIQKKTPSVYVSVMMCTEEGDIVEEYNTKVDPLPGVDVLDDYASEKREVERFKGRKLSLNKYLVKCVLGPKFRKWDDLDEPPAPTGPRFRKRDRDDVDEPPRCQCSLM